ncbi:11783_t:CDS:10 [Dentiscutata erythropus]|uniref:11783_t:CDS:1 n=1 Tax=Dentiscutata erythropus TaxID=1348616 RepID=A0A9N9F2K8_9GLOM|nr:11783_t:CDS:10 [Dentiscutata erythropus]
MSSESILEDYKKIKYFAIFPALNVARVGNSDEYYVGSEIPGVYVGKGDESFLFKDSNNKVKPQAARFRIYGYDERHRPIREIKLTDADACSDVKIKITWNVELANKKAAHTQFSGILKYKESDPKRNAKWPYDRSTLMAITRGSLSSDEEQKTKELTANVYRHSNNNNSGKELHLGKLILENTGSLLVIGGKGESGSVKDGALITQYANNDYWYDDTSDGSIDATVEIGIDSTSMTTIQNREGKSWILVAPPKYAPGIRNLVPLYQIISETQHPVDPEHPIDPEVVFDLDNRVDPENPKMAFKGHGLHKQGDFLNPDMEKHLKNPRDNINNKDLRNNILSRVRIPKYLASSAEFNGQAYDYFMPPLSGNDGDTIPTAPDTYLTVSRGQYILLQKWADGDFEEGKPPKEYYYKFEMNDANYPQYVECKKNYKFEEIVPNVLDQIKCLNKAALQWCVGGAFFPGIEMTYLSYDKNTFEEKYDFRINDKNIGPGDINAFMALPWQADFYECNTHWWPAQRPDITIPYSDERKKDVEKYGVSLDYFEDWTRGFRTDEPNRGMPKWGDMDMANKWDRQVRNVLLGFIVEKQLEGENKAFFEVERNDIFKVEMNTVDEKENKFNLDDLHEMLKIAMMVEISTIPAYLYALYSIKPGTEIGDEVRAQIRHVAAEEMLHLSLVANLITAIGRQPKFYSQEMIPFYPNPLPHIKQGSLIIHLSKANKITLETFINIEKPDPDQITNVGIDEDEINADSIGDLYDGIKKIFKFLDKQNKIKYDTLFQLGPGMGYAPSSGDKNFEGLILVKECADAIKAINLIIHQGEGGRCIAEKIKATVNVKINGEIKDGSKVKIQGGKITGEIYGKVLGEIKGIIKGTVDDEPILINDNDKVPVINGGVINNGEIDDSHYAVFSYCLSEIESASESDYQLWPVVDDPNATNYTNPLTQDEVSYADPNIVTTLIAFNAAYSYLMLLLQAVWRTDGQKKKMLIMGGMPALMHGVLKPIATFLAKTPVSNDMNAGASFGYYEFDNKSSPKDQLKKAVEAASKAFSYSDELGNAVTAVDALPDVSQEVFLLL